MADPDIPFSEGGHELRPNAMGTVGRCGGRKFIYNTIITRFQSVCGTVEAPERLLAQLYGSKQAENEDVSSWGCRIENHLIKSLKRQGDVHHPDTNEMLWSVFWRGLRKELCDISDHN